MRITGYLLTGLLEAAPRLGLLESELLEGLASDEHDSAPPGAAGTDLLGRLADAAGDPALGLHFGSEVSLAAFDAPGLLALVAPTFRDALRVFERYHELALEGARLKLTIEGDCVLLELSFVDSPVPAARRFVSEALAVLLVRVLGDFAPGATAPVCSFDYPAPAYRAEYERLLGGGVVFDANVTTFEAPATVASRRRTAVHAHLQSTLWERSERLLARARAKESFSDRVLRVVRALPRHERPTADGVARTLGVSPKTLRGRLTDEGADFSLLLHVARGQAARSMLRDGSRSVKDVATTFGFTDAAAFHRAFKRWTGLTPGEARRTA